MNTSLFPRDKQRKSVHFGRIVALKKTNLAPLSVPVATLNCGRGAACGLLHPVLPSQTFFPLGLCARLFWSGTASFAEIKWCGTMLAHTRTATHRQTEIWVWESADRSGCSTWAAKNRRRGGSRRAIIRDVTQEALIFVFFGLLQTCS